MQGVTDFEGLFGEALELVFAEALFVGRGSFVGVRAAGGEECVDELRKFVSHGGDGFRGTQAGLQTASECSQGAVGADDRLSAQTQNSGSSVGAGTRFSSPAPCSAAGFVRAGAEAQPTTKMFDRRKRGHVSADF